MTRLSLPFSGTAIIAGSGRVSLTEIGETAFSSGTGPASRSDWRLARLSICENIIVLVNIRVRRLASRYFILFERNFSYFCKVQKYYVFPSLQNSR